MPNFNSAPMEKTNQDPLYTIFEQHLFNFQDPNADRETFILGIVKDYISQVRKLGLSIPAVMEEHIYEELCLQVSHMLVKKIYGCLTINEYTAKVPTEKKKQARTRYRKLATTAAAQERKRSAAKKAA